MRTLGAILLALAASATLSGSMTGCSSTPKEDNVLPGVDAVLFVKRAYLTEDGSHNVTDGVGQVFDYDRYNPGKGSGLYVLEPPSPDGKLRNLTENFDGVDINGMDLSFDAKKVVFSMRIEGDNRYHLYLANIDGSGKVKQLTFHDADDTQPVFVAGGRVAFVTNQPFTQMGTRADEYNHAQRVTQIGTISEIGGDADRSLCSQNLSHTTAPFTLANGLIGFSRWEHLGPVNDVKLFTMRPDCTQMRALAGQHDKPFNSIVQVREIATGEFLGVATTREGTIQSGALMHINVPYKAVSNTLGFFDEQAASFDNLTLSVPTDMSTPASGVGRYRSPHIMPDSKQVIVSWADGDVNERNELAGTAPNFGLYLWDPQSGKRKLIYDDPKLWDLYATPVVARAEPPVLKAINDGKYDVNMPAVVGSINVHDTSLEENVSGGQFGEGLALSKALKQAHRVRVIEGFSSEIGSVGQFGLTMHEGAAILGEAEVHSDGSWAAKVPPYLPMHLQPIDRFDMAIRNQLLWIQAMPGETRTCGGCHESRKGEVAALTTEAQQRGPTEMLNPIAERTELPWFKAVTGTQVQNVFDAKCVSCHSGGANDPFAGKTYHVEVTFREGGMQEFDVPILDLSSRSLMVAYEDEAVTYPASYISLLFPSAMMGDVRIEGAPVEWVIPGSARSSRLIAKININGAQLGSDGTLTGTDEWAFKGKPHPEDVGVELTREERVTLIRSVDLGAQYYSRRNVDGTQFTGMDYTP